jgi:hypothetical protein
MESKSRVNKQIIWEITSIVLQIEIKFIKRFNDKRWPDINVTEINYKQIFAKIK